MTRPEASDSQESPIRGAGRASAFLHKLGVIHDTTPRPAAMQMAVDEALLSLATIPTLRFYHWGQPSLSFGYFGRYADVAAEAPHRDVVRRWTGGGIVLHGSDVTYSLIIPARFLPENTAARSVYTTAHLAIARVLGTADVELAAADAPKISDSCFANAVAADVLASGRKIAGAAQRRTRAGLLQQGSIQYEHLRPTFQREFANALCPMANDVTLRDEVIAHASDVAAAKYATAAWLHRH